MSSMMPDEANARACKSQLTGSTDDATGSLRPPEVGTHAGGEIRPSSADPTDRSGRHINTVLEVPITWLGLTPPSGSLHLKVMETRYAHRAELWSSGMSPDEQMAWASSQGGWTIRGEHHVRSFVVSFSVGSPPAGLAWLARRSSFQRLDLHPDGKVHLHLSGPRKEILAVHRRLGRATEVKVLYVADAEDGGMPVRRHVADAEDEGMPDRRPRLTTAQ